MARTNRRRNNRLSRRGSSKHRGFLGGATNSFNAENYATVNYPGNMTILQADGFPYRLIKSHLLKLACALIG